MAVVAMTPILIVDDYNDMVRVVRNLQRRLGFRNVDEASDSALATPRRPHYALVISDATKPELVL